jgi:ribosomal protein S18 acetylase RimI-like enzyme
MNAAIRYAVDQASCAEVEAHLGRCDARFTPPLHTRVDIRAYAAKICQHAVRFEAWSDGMLVGLAAAYLNGAARLAFITNVSVEEAHCRAGVATALLERLIGRARALGLRKVSLEVSSEQPGALRLYERCGFASDADSAGSARMSRTLEEERADA